MRKPTGQALFFSRPMGYREETYRRPREITIQRRPILARSLPDVFPRAPGVVPGNEEATRSPVRRNRPSDLVASTRRLRESYREISAHTPRFSPTRFAVASTESSGRRAGAGGYPPRTMILTSLPSEDRYSVIRRGGCPAPAQSTAPRSYSYPTLSIIRARSVRALYPPAFRADIHRG